VGSRCGPGVANMVRGSPRFIGGGSNWLSRTRSHRRSCPYTSAPHRPRLRDGSRLFRAMITAFGSWGRWIARLWLTCWPCWRTAAVPGRRGDAEVASLGELDQGVGVRIYLCTAPTDMRKGFDSLAALVSNRPTGWKPVHKQSWGCAADGRQSGRFSLPLASRVRGTRRGRAGALHYRRPGATRRACDLQDAPEAGGTSDRPGGPPRLTAADQ
jgi:hypothetical protein